MKKTRSLLGMVKPLGMARWAESPGAAREHNEPHLGSVGTPDAGIAAVKILLDHLLDDRPEKTILPLETTLILRQEPVEMMEEYPVADCPACFVLLLPGQPEPLAADGPDAEDAKGQRGQEDPQYKDEDELWEIR